MPSKGGRRRKRAYDFEAFRGYRGPRFTPIPDEFLDHQLAYVSSAEAKVMLFLFRKTYGYRKSGDRVSLAQLERGTIASDGTIIDRGTGLSRATIWRALKGLQEKGLIEVHRQTTPFGDSDINYYRIREDLGQESGGTQEAPIGERGDPLRSPRSRDLLPSDGGSFSNETTPFSELNHRPLRSKPRGGLSSEPTRMDSTREDSTLSPQESDAPGQKSAIQGPRTAETPTEREEPLTLPLDDIARRFLKAIGYVKPATAKRERTIRVLRGLQREGSYTAEELQAACEIAASMGARGPELIPHVIGRAQTERPEAKVGERLTRHEEQERLRWQSLTAEFEALSEGKREALLQSARESSDILAQRPPDHPLVRAAAIALLDEG